MEIPMNKIQVIQTTKKNVRMIGKYLLIVVIIFVFIAGYLLIADFFYDGRFD